MKNENNLLKEVEELKIEIKKLKSRKKYGLVWEEEIKPEQVFELCKQKLPVLVKDDTKEISVNLFEAHNILIEGDNYHSLSVLNYTHQGKIDLIYIDPPYNTGSEGFMYNDKIVNKEDSFRHSKWLNFMDKRLRLAKNLLSQNGVMFISIDDNEVAKLRMLCDEIFREDWVDLMIWRKSGVGRDGKMKNTTTFRKDHEYVIVIFKNQKRLNKIIETPDFKNEYGNPDNDPRGTFKAGSISLREEASKKGHKNYYSVISPSGKKFTRQFDIPKEEFEKLYNDVLVNNQGKKVSRIYWGKNGDAVPSIKIYINEQRAITPYSILMKGTTTGGTSELENILGGDFSSLRPKPSKLIKTLIQLGSQKDSIILDFFAGSGTTGQATLELNKDDKGNRKFILCTNDEGGICTKTCYPRLKKVISGFIGKEDKNKYPALGGNLKYFKTDFVEAKQTDQNKKKLVDKSTEMLCLKEDCFELVKKGQSFKIFTANKDKYLGIIYDDAGIDLFKKEAKRLDKKIITYVFSLDDSAREEEFEDIKKLVQLKPIPAVILNVYKRIFK